MDTYHRPKVLFIGGAGRSGTTLLELMLGTGPSFFAAGELTHLWERGCVQNQLCGCGVPFRDCAFWRGVTDRLNPASWQELVELRYFCCSLPRILLGTLCAALLTRRNRSRLERYARAMTDLYESIRSVSQCDIVIDSSKYPAEAFLLNFWADVDVYVVHLIRDPRSVVYSWQRKKIRPEIHWKTELMPRYSTGKIAAGWTTYNLAFHCLGLRNPRYIKVLYEDLVRDPQRELDRIIEWLGVDPSGTAALHTGNRIEFGENHTVSGNPIRFDRGEVALTEDRKWIRNMSRSKVALTTLLTWPLMLRYGYGARHGRERPDATG
jgi:hypothetical protein